MTSTPRIAVLGLYNSGSTAVAGVLHRLGVNMGPPFWETSDDGSAYNFYEPYDLAWHLRRWWDEPHAIERVAAADRIRFLSGWIALQETVRPGPSGAKHPLLSLCANDIAAAWGPNTRFIWCWRPLGQSISGLQRRGWFTGYEESLQQSLWDALHEFESSRADVAKLDWARVKSDPEWSTRELAALTELELSETELRAAAKFIRAEPA